MIDAKTIHAMGNMPKAAPFSVDINAYLTGMPYTVSATTHAAASAVDDIADVQRAVRRHHEPAAAGRRQGLAECAVFGEHRQPLVVAVGHDDASLLIDHDSMRELELAGLGPFLSADDPDELAVAR